MISYSLACDNGHDFDGWFRNSGDFDKQKERGLVACPHCNSSSVSKRLMAPNVSTSRSKKKAQVEHQVAQVTAAAAASQAEKAAPPTQPSSQSGHVEKTEPVSAASAPAVDLQKVPAKAKELVEALREFRKQVVSSSEYVGDKFAEEARKIHYGESEERGIYGETTTDDAKELIEEGIDLLALPALPEDRN